ncbi:RluA family pseudouridine synthase [Terricaulis silvestris]|uniref:Pseudouridine synthase n=1 Tax=Terricaulis silvestris TaxID=2686094 RepID=A0A6I6MLZ1_9CAUL|nr:RluA family pseudouridine synthase [Terricaulis silvestris]QGZ94328.1 Ribosomal large subunit pseudouridine synthase D [Terricaulis silvestris]
MSHEDQDSEEPGETRTAVAPDGAGDRVDVWLAQLWPDLSRSRVQGLIGAGKLSVDGAPVTHAKDKPRAGARYALILPPPEPAAPQPETLPITVVYEDADLIVIDKASGMAMHPAPGSMRGTLVNALLAHCGDSLSGIGGVARPGIVHRIDKDTTGLVVVAKHDRAHQGLAKLFAKHNLERVYYAVTRGAPKERAARIENRLVRSGEDRRKYVVARDPNTEAGKNAITDYWTVESFGQQAGASAGRPAAALLECRLHTGRTHQIRAHLTHLGAPLVGDPLYGKQRAFKAEGQHTDEAATAVAAFPRQALHAAVLGFKHPVTGEEMRFESALPTDMEALIGVLRKL